MPDIRIVRRTPSYVWVWSGILALIALAIWAAATFLGDPTDPSERQAVGADADFGAERERVAPPQATPFAALTPLDRGDLGRLVHLTGVAESRLAGDAVWVRAADGRRILVRFEPSPPEEALARVRAGGGIDVEGYLENISLAEFRVWADTLRISLPQRPEGQRFGQLPDREFLARDSLFIRDFYISVRPEGLTRARQEAGARTAGGSL